MSKILGYKIRHSKTKMYLSSLSRDKWTKVGKTWPRKGDVVRSINNGLKALRGGMQSSIKYEKVLDDLPNWEIIELKEASSYSALFLANKLKT